MIVFGLLAVLWKSEKAEVLGLRVWRALLSSDRSQDKIHLLAHSLDSFVSVNPDHHGQQSIQLHQSDTLVMGVSF